MASSSAPSPAPAAVADKLPRASTNPMPLSSAQEQQVRDLYYKRVRGYCADEIREFAKCAENRTFTATWVCRSERLAMNSCMVGHATRDEEDRARAEWFTTRSQRKKEWEEKEEVKKEHEKFHREWWGLDDKGKRPLDETAGHTDGKR
ncbi:MAG: Transcription initiation factor TFIID subunit 9 [Chaenotheca gracillima]|nr:MAG: Transcription initiation factor TFIID subunit 9 [Chaenotheca gracillima]